VTIFRHVRREEKRCLDETRKISLSRAEIPRRKNMFRALTSATSAAASTGTRGFFVSFDAMRFTTSFDPVKMFKATRAASYLCIKNVPKRGRGAGRLVLFSRAKAAAKRKTRRRKTPRVCAKNHNRNGAHSVPQPRFSVVNTPVCEAVRNLKDCEIVRHRALAVGFPFRV